MMKKKKPFSIRLIYWLTQIFYGMIIIVLFAAIGLNIALHVGWLGENLQLHVRLPVQVCYSEAGMLELGNIEQEVRFVEAYGKLHLVNTNAYISKWMGGTMLVVLVILLYISYMFRNFISNVYRGIIFEQYNISMLKKISYGLVGLWFFIIVYSRFFYNSIASRIEFTHLEISGDFDHFGGILVAALLLWVLSHIFAYGVKLQEEQKLTV